MKQKTKKTTWEKVRKLFNDIHLWLGLASGIVVFVVCLSGTLYVFNTELREMSLASLYKTEYKAGAKALPAEVLMAKVTENTGGSILSIKIPSDAHRTYTVTVKKEEAESTRGKGKDERGKRKGEHAGEHKHQDKKPAEAGKSAGHVEGAGKQGGKGKGAEGGGPGPRGPRGTPYMIDPYTGEIKGDASAKTTVSEFMGVMFSLHRWLLLDKIEEPLIGELPNRTLGSYISGAATILFTLGVITGMVIWFPKRIRAWKQGLKIKFSANWKRINHDLHNSLGLYSCIFLFLMGITGPQWSFSWYRDGLRKSLGTYQPKDAPRPEEPVSILSSAGPLNIEDYIKAANKVLPYEGDYSISMPKDSTAAVSVTKNRVGFFAPAAPDRLLLDQYTGKVLKAEIFRDKPFNERISGSIKALHVGDVYGLFTKIIYFFACLIATSLPITGTLIWINKFGKK